MRRRLVLLLTIGAAAAACGGGLAGAVPAGVVRAGAVRAASLWGRAIGVPGLEALSKGRAAQVISVSCTSPGNCAAAGEYRARGRRQVFVVSERHGRWGRAMEVPGLGALNKGGYASLDEVSCASAGNCAAGGAYQAQGAGRAFVVSERNGRWGRAIGTGGAEVFSVSCGSAGNCAAVGDYSRRSQGFVVDERNGRWARATVVPGLAALNKGGFADANSVSCASAGNCAVGGSYMDGGAAGNVHGFVVSEQNGRWGRAIPVPGLEALNRGGSAEVVSVSCASAGNCAAGGDYSDAHNNEQGFVVSEENGRWGRAIEVPGLGALNTGGLVVILSVSCASAGNCAAGGWYTGATEQGFVAIEKNGRWGRAIQLPGLAALSRGGYDTQVYSVSCGSVGSCAAGGDYTNRQGQEAFVAVERNGRWGTAVEVPGMTALSKRGTSDLTWVSCASASSCAASGTYGDPFGPHGFVTG